LWPKASREERKREYDEAAARQTARDAARLAGGTSAATPVGGADQGRAKMPGAREAKQPAEGEVQAPRRPMLYGPTGRRRGDMGYFSDDEHEWASDVQLCNAFKLLLTVPKLTDGGRLLVLAPRHSPLLCADDPITLWNVRPLARILNGSCPKDVVACQICEGLHWRFIAVCGTSADGGCVYYWNPYGTDLPQRHSIRSYLKAFPTFKLIVIRDAVQPGDDDYQCGMWAHVALARFLEYARLGQLGTQSFQSFFTAQVSEFRPIPSKPGKERRVAVAANVAYAKAVRALLRSTLWQAALAGSLPHGLNAQIEHLGQSAADSIDLDEADTNLDSDDEDASA